MSEDVTFFETTEVRDTESLDTRIGVITGVTARWDERRDQISYLVNVEFAHSFGTGQTPMRAGASGYLREDAVDRLIKQYGVSHFSQLPYQRVTVYLKETALQGISPRER